MCIAMEMKERSLKEGCDGEGMCSRDIKLHATCAFFFSYIQSSLKGRISSLPFQGHDLLLQ